MVHIVRHHNMTPLGNMHIIPTFSPTHSDLLQKRENLGTGDGIGTEGQFQDASRNHTIRSRIHTQHREITNRKETNKQKKRKKRTVERKGETRDTFEHKSTHTPTTNTRDTYATNTTTVSRRDIQNEKRCNKAHTPSPTGYPNARTKKKGTIAIRNVGRLALLILMTMTQLITVQERTETWNSDKGNGITMKQLNGTERMGQKEETVPKTATEEKKQNQEQDTGHAIKQHKMTKINEDTKKIKHTNSTNDCPRGKRSAGTMAQTSSSKRMATTRALMALWKAVRET